MIPFIRKSLENGTLVVKDHITVADESFYRCNAHKPIIHEHRIMLEDTRTGERVLVGVFKEGE